MKPLEFCGVDGVRVIKRGKVYQVQTQWSDPKDPDAIRGDWKDIGDSFKSLGEAEAQAPYLCNF